MSLDAAFSKGNVFDLPKVMGGGSSGNAASRGRSNGRSGDQSPNDSRAVSRGRHDSRGRSNSRRRNGSRARSQGEDINWRWSILRHDPSERIRGDGKISSERFRNGLNNDGEDSDVSENSEEEQISDDEADFVYDINEVVLPNYRISINDFYKKKSHQPLTSLTESLHITESNKEKEEELKLKKQEALEAKKRKDELDELLNNKAEELKHHSEILSLGKALSDINSSGAESAKDISEIHEKLKALGVEDPQKITIEYIIEVESKKDKVYDEYKKLLIDKSKEEAEQEEQEDDTPVNNDNKITESSKIINKEQLRVSKTLTLGNFFNSTSSKKVEDVESYLIYLDLTSDSVNALQYTIGSVVKSGDVLYVVNSVEDETDIEYYEKQCDKLNELIMTYLKLIETNEEFTLHVILETTHHKYPKHLVNELVKYLKPNLFIVGHSVLLGELSNYITDIPLLVVKKKVRRKSAHRII